MAPAACTEPHSRDGHGGSDGSHLRRAGIDTYADDIRAHGRDERIPAQAFYRGLEFTYRLPLELGTPRYGRLWAARIGSTKERVQQELDDMITLIRGAHVFMQMALKLIF
jgi:hypothetical protein